MTLAHLLERSSILAPLRANSSNHALQLMCDHASELTSVPSLEIYKNVMVRERLGSTNVGGGVAIPHGRLAKTNRSHLIFGKLETALYFSREDIFPVDLIFLLLTPKEYDSNHLQALASIARFVRNDDLVLPLRQMTKREDMYRFLSESPAIQPL